MAGVQLRQPRPVPAGEPVSAPPLTPPPASASPAPPAPHDASLLDLLDRVLDKGVVLSGDVTLSVADVDLVYVGLRALVAAVHKVVNSNNASRVPAPASDHAAPGDANLPNQVDDPAPELQHHDRVGPVIPERINTDPTNVEKGLAKLVLTLVELLRQLMERQAIRRMEGGSLTDQEVERLGQTFMKLQQRMTELKKTFGLEHDELNLNLGPLGKLL